MFMIYPMLAVKLYLVRMIDMLSVFCFKFSDTSSQILFRYSRVQLKPNEEFIF
jgi:hypothetical protein